MNALPGRSTEEVRKSRDHLDEDLCRLPGDEAKVLKYRYGMDIGRLMAFDEVAAVIGKTTEEVQELAGRGLRSLRKIRRQHQV